jgi:uncharacterized membrane protein
MLAESTVHLSLGLGFLQELIHPPNGAFLARALLRWGHFVGGITWIGMLYFFNLVNVPLQKSLDADTKKKVNPLLLSKTLWFFRWGSVVTVFAGLTYYAMYILAVEARAAGLKPFLYLAIWLAIVLVTYTILFGLYQVPALTGDGRILAVVVAIVMIAMSAVIIYIFGNAGTNGTYLGNKSISIGIGGGMGIIMLANVWSIIWPTQRRGLSALEKGTPAPTPAEMRKAFLASRTNAWLSLPMLFFMGTSHGDWVLFGK